jgi:hypothetical protein
VKAKENCLAHALVIAMAKVKNDLDYKAYRQGRKILPKVRELLQRGRFGHALKKKRRTLAILSLQDMCGVGQSRRRMLSRDECVEGSGWWTRVERGYRVLKIHEVTQYDPTMGEGGHFVQYIDTFLKQGTGPRR